MLTTHEHEQQANEQLHDDELGRGVAPVGPNLAVKFEQLSRNDYGLLPISAITYEKVYYQPAAMRMTLASIAPRRLPKSTPAGAMAAEYLKRAARYTAFEAQLFATEAALLDALDKQQARTPTHLILLDARGQLLTSGEFAQYLGRLRDDGTQSTYLAIGPADGWSAEARARAHLLFSLGRITLPHELARVVLAEQLYRALTILAGHPYHTGHSG